jgi:hypothetical protein
MLIRALVLATASILSIGAARAVDFEFTPVLLQGDPAPASVGGTFGSFYIDRQTSAAGEWALVTQLDGASTSSALFRFSDQATELVAGLGDIAPGAGGGSFDFLFGGPIDAAGDIVFRGGGSQPGLEFGGVFLASKGGGIAPLVLAGETAPSTGGAVFESFDAFAINASGDVAFGAVVRLSADEVWGGLFLISEGAVSALVQDGDLAPGTGGGSFVNFLGQIEFNDSDELVFSASVTGGAATRGIFVHSALGVRAVAVTGAAAPPPGGGSYTGFEGLPGINESGQVIFVAKIDGTPGAGLFVDSSGSVREVAREGDTVPGVPGAFQQIFDPDLNDAGDVVFSATLDSEFQPTGIFAEFGGVLTPVIVLDSTPAPGGGVFSAAEGSILTPSGDVRFGSSISAGPPRSGLFNAHPVTPAVPALSQHGSLLCVLSLLAAAGVTIRKSVNRIPPHRTQPRR